MRKGRPFELLYEQLYKSLDEKIFTITSPAYLIDQITNQKREVDVLIEYEDSTKNRRRISIECRDRSSIQDVLWIEQLITKKNDLNIDITIATTTSTFTEPAIKKANSYGIILETSECIDSEFILKMTENKFATFTYIYSKVADLCLITENQNIVTKDQIKLHFSQEEIDSFEIFLNDYIYWPIDPIEMIDNVQKLYKSRFRDTKPFPIEAKLNIENLDNVKLICGNQKVTDVLIKYIVKPVKHTIPIVSGIITKVPNDNKIKNQIVEYSKDGLKSKFIKLENNYWFEYITENKNPYLRFFEIIDFVIPPFTVEKNSIINIRSKKSESSLGRLDFSEFW